MGSEPTQEKPQTQPTGAERRIAPRYSVEIEVTLQSEHNFFVGFTENMSEGGLFIATHAIKPIGTLIDLRFMVPGAPAPITTKGEVRWVRPFSEANDAPAGMGIQFVQLGEEDSKLIQAFLGSRSPIFYVD